VTIQKLGDGAVRMPWPKHLSPAVARAWPGVVDVCLTEEWLAVYFAEDREPWVPPETLAALAAGDAPSETRGRPVEIPVRYDGVDLESVARELGLSVERVRTLHAGAEYTVAFIGFMPGFAYLTGLPPELEIARLPTPRTRVPKNAVAVAGRYTGVYPFESPGGWRILGSALDVELFDSTRGALLQAGDRVCFRDVR
jgi:UPF0271 protein